VSMDDTKFQENVEALSSKLLEKPKTMASQYNIWWRELCNSSYIFDRRVRANDEVMSFSKADVLELYVTASQLAS
jgi:secreted Zn-dependent insulinase-like peptidase